MNATVHVLPVPRRRSTERPARDRALRGLGATLAATALAAAVVHGAGSEARGVRQLPADARSALYARTVENVATLCRGDGQLLLADFCHEQAELALAFPECDAACTAAARAALRVPTR